MSELDVSVIPSEPVLPMKSMKILLPYGKDVKNIEVDKGNGLLLPGEYNITHGQKSIPLNYKEKISLTERNLLIYDSFEPYPEVDFKVISTQISRGFKILIVNLFPVQYIPKTGKIDYYPKMNLRIDLCPSKVRSGVLTCRNLPQDVARVRRMVENPATIISYKTETRGHEILGNSKTGLVDPADTYSYVVITNETLRDSTGDYTFQNLTQSKIDKGLSATIVTVEDIQSCSDYWWNGLYGDGAPSFNDTACHIRNFIKDAYENWETEYILLGGDGDGADVGGESGDNIIPAREFYATLFMGLGEFIASDLYYACLDGSFDSNGNGTFGEVGDGFDIDPENGEVDLFAEVYVGRAPIDSEEELSNFVRKTLTYENSSGEQYLRDVWMIGEYLGFGGIADWGGNYKDEIKDGCDKHGYTTTGISPDYDVYTMYDKDRYMGEEHIDISSYVGNDNVHIRYRLIADGYTCFAGLYIDDFEIIGDEMQLFFDDMEHGENGWTHNGYIDDWELGMPSYDLGVLKVHSGINCWGTDLDEKYNNNCNQSLISPPINLTGITSSAELTFYIWYDIERDYDYGFVEISTDSGDTWDIIKNYTGRSWWDKEDLTSIINENDVHIINHLGHGNSFHVMKLDEPVKMKSGVIYGPCHDIENLTNENYFFGYSQACFPGAFDNMDYNWNYQPYDSIVEYLVTSEHGAFAFIANTRSGIGAPDTNAPSQHFDREFFDVLYNESIRNLGWANQRSKEKNIGKINMDCIRYCYYQITLFGDPEISIKDPPMPEHDICLYQLDAPDYHLINTTTYVNATIYNRGRNNETDLVVNLSIDDEIVDSTLILSLQSKEYYDVSFTWSNDTTGLYNVSVQVLPVPGEDYLLNNMKTVQIMVTSSPPMKAVVLDSMGTDWASGAYVLLNRYWKNYGTTPITVDYTTLNDELITYKKLVNSSADVLIIAFAWYCPEFPIFHFEYTNDELDAIIRYVEEGHGLIVTCDSFGGNNHRLLPLVGLRDDLPRLFQGGRADNFTLLMENYPLFVNLLTPYHPTGGVFYPADDGSWNDDDLSSGTYVAKTSNSKSVIVVNNGLVYISPWMELNPVTDNLQFLYNAMIWSKYNPPPATPTGLSTLPGDTFIKLSWVSNTEEDLAGYNIYRRASSEEDFKQIDEVTDTATNYQDNELIINVTYYYRITAVDISRYESDYSLEASAIPQDPIRGDANNNGHIDVGDIVFLINYLFRNGPEPPILAAADVNNDGTLEEPKVDIGDVVYLINYLFRNGPPPVYLDWPNHPPIADAGPDQIVSILEPLQFNGSGSLDMDGYIVSYEWDFGDNTTGYGMSTTHQYTTEETFSVTLMVTDDEGKNDSDTCIVHAPIHVPEDYDTIQEAINAAIDRDIIQVAPGTYIENIDFLGKAIIVQSSDGPEVTFIDGNQIGPVVTFSNGETSTSILDGFTIINGSAYNGGGIYCISSSPTITNNIILDNTADNSGGGIYCVSSSSTITNNKILDNTANNGGSIYYGKLFGEPSSLTIVNSTISNNTASYYGGGVYCSETATITSNIISDNIAHRGGGIYCFASSTITSNIISDNNANNGCGLFISGSSNNNITSNNIINNNDGIYLFYSFSDTVSENTLTDNNYGILLEGSFNTTIIENTFNSGGIVIYGDDLHHWNTHTIENNTANGKPIYYYRDDYTSSIVPSDAGQVILANCSNFTLQNLNITNVYYGVQLGFSSYNTISKNTIAENNQSGFYLTYSSDNNITNNNITNNKYGIYLKKSSNNNIFENNICSNNNGYFSSYSNSNNISGNTFADNKYGISIYSSSENNITRNIISENCDGIKLSSSSNNFISKNNIINNNENGINLSSGSWGCSRNNIVYHNNFNNTKNAFDQCNNTWYNATLQEGNYWSDYKEKYPEAVDADNDGIWDTPYEIPGDIPPAQDMYPSVFPYI